MTRNRKKVTTRSVEPQPVDPAVMEQAVPEANVAQKTLAAGAAPQAEPSERTIRCVICSTVTQAGSPDHMCWVCRRLKISAWREVEQQMPAQE